MIALFFLVRILFNEVCPTPLRELSKMRRRRDSYRAGDMQLDAWRDCYPSPQRARRRVFVQLYLRRATMRLLPQGATDLIQRSAALLHRLDPQELVEVFGRVVIAAPEA
jgi:hypothetical protein